MTPRGSKKIFHENFNLEEGVDLIETSYLDE